VAARWVQKAGASIVFDTGKVGSGDQSLEAIAHLRR
jgi:hypothetical protein